MAAFGVLVTLRSDEKPPLPPPPPVSGRPEKITFTQDFKQFFLRGLAALLPTMITLWLLVWAWHFLWDGIGRHLVATIAWLWPESFIAVHFSDRQDFATRLFGVVLSVLAVYIVG